MKSFITLGAAMSDVTLALLYLMLAVLASHGYDPTRRFEDATGRTGLRVATLSGLALVFTLLWASGK